MLHYHVLGQVRVERDGADVHVGGPRQRRLLAALLVHRNEVVSSDRLAEAVFAGKPTPKATTTLRTYVMRLRRAIEDGDAQPAVETVAPGYRLRAPASAVDAEQFEDLVAEGRTCRDRGDPVGAASALRQALNLWRGDPYAEFDGEGWVVAETQRLVELRSVAEEHLVEAELECGLAAELVARLEGLADREPLRERFRAQLMVALYRSGRQADALAVMRDYRETLADAAGLDPSPDIEDLERRILDHDQALLRVEPAEEVVRGYRLGERLGSGRDGTVHAARLPGVDRDLVVRVVPADLADRADVVRSFEATLRRVAALHHDAIVPIDDHWREPGGAWIVMRRLRGGTLADRLAEGGAMAPGAVATLAARIGSALDAAADAGIVHGRVIPQSVLLDEAGTSHLSDFPIGAVDGSHDDDVVAFVALLAQALTGSTAGVPPLDDASGVSASAAQPPGVDVLARALATTPPPPLAVLVADLVAEIGPTGRTSEPVPNPYKGLRAFDEADAADFFGREGLVTELVERLGRPGIDGRLVLVVGASGSGKSSVVRAGLLPAVRSGEVPGSAQWLVATIVPGSTPFKELAEGLASVATTASATSMAGGHDDLADELARGADGIDSALRRIVPASGDLLLVIDQFEEVFTLGDEDLQRRFLDGLVHALSVPDSRLRVVATLRADFYDRPLRFRRIGALVRDATVTVPAMTAAQLESTITGPADRVGLAVEPALAAELVAAVVDQPAAMPSLQFTLHELAARDHERLSLAAYHDLGGAGGAIASRAEALYDSVDDEHDLVRHVFEQLVVLGPEGEPTRRPTPRHELAGLAKDRTIDDVIDPWVQARLLSTDRHPETREPTVEVAHEALLREWPRLRGWIEADRAAITAAGHLREAAAGWRDLDRDPGALYRGTKLDAALEHLGGRADALPTADREFLDASRAARDERSERAAERVAEQARTNRRLRRQLAALAVAMVVALVGGLVALDQRGRAQQQAQLAQDQALIAEEQAVVADEQAARAASEERVAVARELSAASGDVIDQDPELGILLALEAVKRSNAGGSVLPEAEGALHRAVASSRIILTVPGLGGSVDWHPNGTVFVTEGPEESGMVDIRKAQSGDRDRVFAGHDADINVVRFSHDGSLLATAGDDGLLRVWDTATAELQAEFEGDGQVWGVSFTPDDSRVAASWVNEEVVRVLDLVSGESVLEVPAWTVNLAISTSFSPDGTRLAIAAMDRGVIVVDVGTGQEVFTIPTATVTFAVAWSPDGRWIASGSGDGVTRLTDAATGEGHVDLVGHRGDVKQFDWDPANSRLATGGVDGTARVWTVTDDGATELHALVARSSQGAIGGVAFSPDGNRLLTGDVVVTAAKVWDVGVSGGAEVVNLPVSTPTTPIARFTASGDGVVLTGDGASAEVWDVATGQPRGSFGLDSNGAYEIEVDPAGELIATISGEDPRVHVWDRETRIEVLTLSWADFFPEHVGWSSDGALLAISGFDGEAQLGRIRVVDRTGSLVAEMVEEDDFVIGDLVFGPDGDRLIALRQLISREDPSIDGVRVWGIAEAEVLMELPVFAHHLAMDPTGNRIVTADVALGASLWDAEDGGLVATLSGHNGDVTDVTFSPDGATIASGGTDGTVRLWATESGIEQLVLRGHDSPITSVVFSPDGTRLASVGDDVARVWALDIDELVAIARTRLTRGLTDVECQQYLHIETCPAA
ncbi:MAG TPA: BTAD domain-containing putative transcriptional regulator [Nitriliruptoraceae bacterium]|nr:BTAD domain-containing putative transcriptional regulator [Nitriliruptoraceae bacterium]